jgi:hypothetical protein
MSAEDSSKPTGRWLAGQRILDQKIAEFAQDISREDAGKCENVRIALQQTLRILRETRGDDIRKGELAQIARHQIFMLREIGAGVDSELPRLIAELDQAVSEEIERLCAAAVTRLGIGQSWWAKMISLAVDGMARRRIAADPPILVPPGVRLRAILEFVYSRKTMSRVFDPALADMQAEWGEAMVADARWKARWVRIRGYYSVARAASLNSLVGIVKQAIGLWKAS